MIAWGVDCVGFILSVSLRRYNYLLGLSCGIGVSSGLTPIVYIIGGWEHVTRAARVSSSNQEHKFSVWRFFRKRTN